MINFLFLLSAIGLGIGLLIYLIQKFPAIIEDIVDIVADLVESLND